jgi:hypothetical protein
VPECSCESEAQREVQDSTRYTGCRRARNQQAAQGSVRRNGWLGSSQVTFGVTWYVLAAHLPGRIGGRRGVGSRLLYVRAAGRRLLLVRRLEGGGRVHRLEAVALLELQGAHTSQRLCAGDILDDGLVHGHGREDGPLRRLLQPAKVASPAERSSLLDRLLLRPSLMLCWNSQLQHGRARIWAQTSPGICRTGAARVFQTHTGRPWRHSLAGFRPTLYESVTCVTS